jgi:hypothetical protein
MKVHSVTDNTVTASNPNGIPGIVSVEYETIFCQVEWMFLGATLIKRKRSRVREAKTIVIEYLLPFDIEIASKQQLDLYLSFL